MSCYKASIAMKSHINSNYLGPFSLRVGSTLANMLHLALLLVRMSYKSTNCDIFGWELFMNEGICVFNVYNKIFRFQCIQSIYYAKTIQISLLCSTLCTTISSDLGYLSLDFVNASLCLK
jgi:hypothetical protein